MNDKLTMLMILDGFGENPNSEGNAIKQANTPNIDKLMKKYPTTHISASGMAVGLPEGQMGNSEVGHTNIGAGRIVYQELTRITKSIEDGDFFSIPEFNEAIAPFSSLPCIGLAPGAKGTPANLPSGVAPVLEPYTTLEVIVKTDIVGSASR